MHWAAVLSCVLGLYVFSLGPAVMFEQRTQMGGKVLEVVYAPLEWLYETTPLREPLRNYVDFWRSL
jgi:hypothetical protein